MAPRFANSPVLALIGLAVSLGCAIGGGPSEPRSGAAAGAPCERGGDCLGGTCIAPGEGWPGGYCSAVCADTPCDPGSSCERFGTAGTGISLCLALCDGGGCREGYACAIRMDGGAPVCAPP